MRHIVVSTPTSQRVDRVVGDICSMQHNNSTAARQRALRYIAHVLQDANSRRHWWFLDRVSATTLSAGQDVVELRGSIDTIAAVYCGKRLNKTSLAHVTELRQAAAANSTPNSGKPSKYALERTNTGLRVHLWPAPADVSTTFSVLYTRPMDLAILTDFWETIVLNGVLGTFGRHFDRDQLASDPQEFERRYEAQLARGNRDSWDIERITRYDDDLEATSTQGVSSDTGTATAYTVPASLTGIGYVTIETGDYPLVVG